MKRSDAAPCKVDAKFPPKKRDSFRGSMSLVAREFIARAQRTQEMSLRFSDCFLPNRLRAIFIHGDKLGARFRCGET